MKRVLCLGECMVELRHVTEVSLRLSYAGDTYNTAVYLRRVAAELELDAQVGYLTGLGDDGYSQTMRSAWRAEGIVDCSITVPRRAPGLYTVCTDSDGERRFAYWRSSSAARRLFATSDWISRVTGDLVHLSGITLQLMPAEVRDALTRRLHEVKRAGGLVSFDTNYRPAGWSSPATAAAAMAELTSLADITFASWEDEVSLHGPHTPQECAERIAGTGCAEVVVKLGAAGVQIRQQSGTSRLPAVPVAQAVDTTAAGDSFAGGYLAARLGDLEAKDAARIGAQVAARVVSHPGAIAPQAVRLTQHAPSGMTSHREDT